MYPTLFRIPFLPDWLADIRSYGVMMMIAFLTGIWMACRRAMRSRADPDIVLNMGMIALIGGVVGARAMFVLHYWDSRFANQPNPLLAVFDVRAGGLEFYGGPLLVIPALFIYLKYFAKASARWYLDITAPSLAWGLAITRIGCFLNGCCWGSLCVDPHDPSGQRAALPWAVRFPYGSPAVAQQYRFGQLTLPKELIFVAPSGVGESSPLPAEYLAAAAADNGRTRQRLETEDQQAAQALRAQQAAGADAETMKPYLLREKAAREAVARHDGTPTGEVDQLCSHYELTPLELATLASHYRSRPVHPTQLYETVSGLLLCALLTLVFYRRRRHGIVLPWFLILYAVSRWLLEAIRNDNPLDVAGLTISQAISVGTFAAGAIWLLILYRTYPLRSALVQPFVFEEDEEERAPSAVARKLR